MLLSRNQWGLYHINIKTSINREYELIQNINSILCHIIVTFEMLMMVLVIMRRALCAFFHLDLPVVLPGRCYCSTHFINEETEAPVKQVAVFTQIAISRARGCSQVPRPKAHAVAVFKIKFPKFLSYNTGTYFCLY